MRVTVQLFAVLREHAGTSAWACDVAEGTVVQDVWQRLVSTHEGLSKYTGAVSCAVNEEFARMDTPLHPGDDVAFLPPVSGGAK